MTKNPKNQPKPIQLTSSQKLSKADFGVVRRLDRELESPVKAVQNKQNAQNFQNN